MRLTRRLGLALIFATSVLASARAEGVAGGYAVVISKATQNDQAWAAVATALAEKHAAEVITYDGDVAASLPRLKDRFPRFTCFVARPEEADKEFVARIHRMTRQLDADPYTDTSWGILTGYTPEAALRIAKLREPLTIRNVAAGTEVALEMCEQGRWYSEVKPNQLVVKEPGAEPRQEQGPADTTQALADALAKADLFVTSGHATEHDWQIGYGYKNGTFRCKDGKLYGLDLQKKEITIDAPTPKVYLAVGNCLMGHVDGKNAMALAWMNNAGVAQMVGYTDLTWFGYGGWGQLDYFVEQPGRYTLAEAFLANDHAMVERLRSGAAKRGDIRGLEYDRDIVAFYGDPAWEARMAEHPKAWDQSLTHSDGLYTLDIIPRRGESTFKPINTNGSQRGGRPILQFLPHRVEAVEIVEGSDLKPVVADDFVLVPNPGVCDPNQVYRISFRAKNID
ncbi:Peptidase family C25 [Singulisphaera sp. GP187]|uniref:C25 family cysteine peptidase n=1 Tax=Singulisphaera sp. GP187 TaxID=1882752 RepID=UPI00092C8669|nr:C25 family cysteine peptidase [Singulisphaera sp. GP187]SIO60576.1 Peptidase family C25 [Singulisphaera sp. GP187]